MTFKKIRIIRPWLKPGALRFGLLTCALSSPLQATECLGPAAGSTGNLIYLHGFEPLAARSNEEAENRVVLERLARELKLRIALPRGAVCPKQRLCWPAKDPFDIEKTFALIQGGVKSCWTANQPYRVLGFSNGGFYAFKLYKSHRDPLLRHIVAAGASGLWDPGKDKPNPLSQFQLMIGSRDMTLRDARQLAEKLRLVEPNFALHVFNGGHRLDYDTLLKILKAQK